jgi:hypothetical protein
MIQAVHRRWLQIARRTTAHALTGAALSAMFLVVAAAPAHATVTPRAQSNCFNGTGNVSIDWSNRHAVGFAVNAPFCIFAPFNRNLRLVWQADGNLVEYNNGTANTNARWSSGTAGRGKVLQFQFDGNVVIYDVNQVALWHTSPSGNRIPSTTYRMEFVDRLNTTDVVRTSSFNPNAVLWQHNV